MNHIKTTSTSQINVMVAVVTLVLIAATSLANATLAAQGDVHQGKHVINDNNKTTHSSRTHESNKLFDQRFLGSPDLSGSSSTNKNNLTFNDTKSTVNIINNTAFNPNIINNTSSSNNGGLDSSRSSN
jgi:hypothetical protein